MSGYEDYFKRRRTLTKKIPTRQRKILRSSSLWLGVVASILAGGCGWYLSVGDQTAIDLMSRLEISLFGNANAAEEKSADQEKPSEAKPAAGTTAEVLSTKAPPKSWSEEEVTLFKKLEARKKQLDLKEVELTKLEEELQKHKDEIEKRLTSLEEVRSKIASKLEDKVKVDGQKVDTLVSVYANMKPAQAAKVIESINEDLAVEVLSKMKNKNAAEILNLMSSEMAKKLSERFAGFREPAQAAR
jgi:flagellar motility protein MotE (MotC chaperone)